MNDQAHLLLIDQMIDEIVTGNTTEHDNRIIEEGASREFSLASDETLVTELRALEPVDWPPDEAGDRISLGVAAEWRHALSDSKAGSPGKEPPRPHRQTALSNPYARRWIAAGVAASVVLIAVLVAVPHGQGPPKIGQHSTTSPVVSPGSSLKMRLVDSTASPFQTVGAGPQTGYLDCATATVCYASGGDSPGSAVALTGDGGRTWQTVAALPDGAALSWPLSCPTAEVCYGVASGDASAPLEVAAATDEGAHWTLQPLTEPPGMSGAAIDQLSCATSQECVVHILGTATAGGARDGTFLSTTDGGATWTTATAVPAEASLSLWTLQCDSAACIGLTPLASAQDPDSGKLATLSSVDGGLTWRATSSELGIGKGILLTSCGDTLHCIAAYPSGTSAMTIATTSDGGASWQVTAAPATWPSIATSISCASGLDCYLAAASYTKGTYDDPVIEATHDGGSTWVPLSLPTVDGAPLALVYPLSCPVAAGCIGVGATPAELEPPPSSPTAMSGSKPPAIPIKCDVVHGSSRFGTVSCSFSPAGSRPITCHVAITRPFTCQGVLENGDRVTISNHPVAAPTSGEWVIISARSGAIDAWSAERSPSPVAGRVIISNLPESGP
jgi:hypothetical protein